MKKNLSVMEPDKFDNMKELIQNTVKKYPNDLAFKLKIKDGKYREITYTEFYENIVSFGAYLLEKGYQGKKIALIGRNRYEWLLSYFATLCGVGIIVPLDKGLPPQEISSSLKRSNCEVIIFESKYEEVMKNIKENENTTVKEFICMDDKTEFMPISRCLEEGRKLSHKKYLNQKIDSDAPTIHLYTSGTTSSSKAVMLSQKNVTSNVRALSSAVKKQENDVVIAFLPFHHTLGMIGTLYCLAYGVPLVFCDGLRYIKQNLVEYGVTVFISVPLIIESMYQKIMQEVEKQGKLKKLKFGMMISKFLQKFGIDIRRKLFQDVLNGLGGRLRLIVNGGAAIERTALEGFRNFGIETLQGYGLTETSPILTVERIGETKRDSVGYPLPEVEVAIENPDENGVGEIKAKGPNIMKGYYENEEMTNEVLKDGWFYTGDLGRIDKDGFLYITGRKKNVIVLKNGKNVFPEELETELLGYPYILEALVYDVIDKEKNVTLGAKIVYNKEMFADKTPEEIQSLIWKDIKDFNKTMTNYKHIQEIIVTDEPMEKTSTNKIKRFVEIEKIRNLMNNG